MENLGKSPTISFLHNPSTTHTHVLPHPKTRSTDAVSMTCEVLHTTHSPEEDDGEIKKESSLFIRSGAPRALRLFSARLSPIHLGSKKSRKKSHCGSKRKPESHQRSSIPVATHARALTSSPHRSFWKTETETTTASCQALVVITCCRSNSQRAICSGNFADIPCGGCNRRCDYASNEVALCAD